MPRLVTKAPALLHALLLATAPGQQSWIETLKKDIAWLTDVAGSKCKDLRELQNVRACMQYAKNSKQSWKHILKVANSEAVLRIDKDFLVERWPSQVVQSETHICAECGAMFGAAGSLCAHFTKVHVHNVARLYAQGDQCRACLKRFDSRSHVIHHLAFSKKRCLDLLRIRCEPLSADMAAELDREECQRRRVVRATGRNPRLASRPAHRLQGPLLRPLPVPQTPPGTPPSEDYVDANMVIDLT